MISGVRIAGALFALTLCSCSSGTPVRVLVSSDTVTINTTLWTALDAPVLDSRGHVIAGARMRYESPDTALITVRNGAVACRADGVARVSLSVDSLRAVVPVRCYIARRFGPTRTVELMVGGSAAPFVIDAYDGDGRLMIGARLPVSVQDTTILQLRSGMVTGLRPGISSISTQSAGRTGGAIFRVVTPPADSAHPVPRDHRRGAPPTKS